MDDCRDCRNFPATSTGTAAISVMGSGMMRSAVPSAMSFFPELLGFFTRLLRQAFVLEVEVGNSLSETSFVADLMREVSFLTAARVSDKDLSHKEN